MEVEQRQTSPRVPGKLRQAIVSFKLFTECVFNPDYK